MDSHETYKFSEGYVNEVWADKGVVRKRFDSIPTVFVSKERRFNNEVEALKIFGGIVAPRLLFADSVSQCVVMEKLDGNNLKVECAGYDLVAKESAAAQFGKMMNVVHNFRPLGISQMTVLEYANSVAKKSWDDLELFYKSGVLEQVGFKVIDLARTLESIVLPAMRRVALAQEKLSYLHGDCWSNNAIGSMCQGQVRVQGIIDWEFCQLGIREEDLAQLYMWEFAKSAGFPKSGFEKGYGPIDYEKVQPFIFLKLLDYMEGASLPEWQRENGNSNGFLNYHLGLLTRGLSVLCNQ